MSHSRTSAHPIRSMTGFARVRAAVPAGELTLSLRSVNHRTLDLHFHIPSDLDPYEPAMRKAIQGEIGRGHVEVRIALNDQVPQLIILVFGAGPDQEARGRVDYLGLDDSRQSPQYVVLEIGGVAELIGLRDDPA